jgi:hypothetical protein
MIKRLLPAIALGAVLTAGPVSAQDYPVLDEIAQKVIDKYQNATCEQLWLEKAQNQGQPKSDKEQRAIQLLQQNQGLQAAFFNQVATPIVTKMFQCGMIP